MQSGNQSANQSGLCERGQQPAADELTTTRTTHNSTYTPDPKTRTVKVPEAGSRCHGRSVPRLRFMRPLIWMSSSAYLHADPAHATRQTRPATQTENCAERVRNTNQARDSSVADCKEK